MTKHGADETVTVGRVDSGIRDIRAWFVGQTARYRHFALPPRSPMSAHNGEMAKRKRPGAEQERLERQHLIVQLRRGGSTFREIAAQIGLSKSTVARSYQEAMANAPAVVDITAHKSELIADTGLLIESLRFSVHDDERRPRAKEVDRFLRAIGQKGRLLDLFGPGPSE